MTEEEVNVGLRAEAAERRRKALTRVETLDLSQTTWPELPHTRVVNAITFVARAGLNRYPHLRGSALRDELAARHGVDPGRLILGNGAAELLSSAARALIEPGQQPDTRVVVRASPNDPTGELVPASELQRLINEVPEEVAVLLDE